MALLTVVAHAAIAQQPKGSPLRAVGRTMYSDRTELFAEFAPPLVVGQPTRLTAHLTKVGPLFKPYTEGKIVMTLTVEGTTMTVTADGPEREGVFRLPTTPTKAGIGQIVIELASLQPPDRFVLDNVKVDPDLQTALAEQGPAETGLVSYSKESQWATDWATAPVTMVGFGAARTVEIPASAIVRDGGQTRVYVLRTAERYELRPVTTGRTASDTIEITSGLKEGERVVSIGAAKMPGR
jgi:hypothetical protein